LLSLLLFLLLFLLLIAVALLLLLLLQLLSLLLSLLLLLLVSLLLLLRLLQGLLLSLFAVAVAVAVALAVAIAVALARCHCRCSCCCCCAVRSRCYVLVTSSFRLQLREPNVCCRLRYARELREFGSHMFWLLLRSPWYRVSLFVFYDSRCLYAAALPSYSVFLSRSNAKGSLCLSLVCRLSPFSNCGKRSQYL
jgi:hypothetical protein